LEKTRSTLRNVLVTTSSEMNSFPLNHSVGTSTDSHNTGDSPSERSGNPSDSSFDGSDDATGMKENLHCHNCHRAGFGSSNGGDTQYGVCS
jgi:hypothetical protein